MKLHEIMTRDVITIGSDAPLKEAARRMVEAGISGLPVTDDSGNLVGIITEADFVKKEANRRAKKRARLLQWLDRDGVPDRHQTVGDVMTEEVISLDVDADTTAAARLMQRANIKRVPVLSGDGRLAGPVSRRDLLRVFARSDADIRDEIADHVMLGVLWIDPKLVEVVCDDGNVALTGKVETRSDANLLAELAGRVDGVVSVIDHLTWEVDNTRVEMVPGPPPIGRGW
jgi:CBS domain-containing protein